jgi:hypothetical protein
MGSGVLQGNGTTVLYDPSLRASAEHVAAIYPDIKARLEGIFGWPVDFEPTVVLVSTRERFQKMSMSPFIVAYALPRNNGIVIDHSLMNVRPFTLEITLQHELCHLLLHRHVDDAVFPRWLDEGLCQWASDGIGEMIMDFGQSPLSGAVLQGRFILLQHLEDRFPSQQHALMLAYAESKAFINFLIKRFGPNSVLGVMNRLKRGEDVDAAFAAVFGHPVGILEGQWHETLSRKASLLARLTYHLYEIIFVLGAAVMLFAFIRVMLRKRAYMKQTEDDDKRTLH